MTDLTRHVSRRSRSSANWCQHCGQTGHLIPECHAYSLHVPRYSSRATLHRYPLLAQVYAHEPGCLSLEEAVNFDCLLSNIRHHLYTSTDTQWYYVSIARESQSKLLEGSCEGEHQPSLNDFHSFIADHWPTFRTIHELRDKVLWGRVSNQVNSPHEVEIMNSLVSAAEASNLRPWDFDLPLPLYNLILTVVILHELSHSFTKYLFNRVIAPQGVGPTQGGYGESGWMLETQLMQGVVSASWDHEIDIGMMRRIKRVVLEKDGSDYVIDVDAAEKFLQSLNDSHLTPPLVSQLAESRVMTFVHDSQKLLPFRSKRLFLS